VTGRRRSPVNDLVRWLVHNRALRRLIDRHVCELSFSAGRTGRPVVLPVMYAASDDQLVILVGRSRSKRWWRNFDRPHPVRVWLRGSPRNGFGHVVPPGAPERVVAEKVYAARYPRIPTTDDPFVVVLLEPAPS
jgi:hypothetical protein